MSIETLGQAWQAGGRVRASCLGRDASTKKGPCTWLKRIDLDMETLLWTRGRDFPISRLPQRLKCAPPAAAARPVWCLTFRQIGSRPEA